MMKNYKLYVKKTAVFILAVCMAFFTFAGCDKQPDYAKDPSTIVILVWSGGYGTKWVEDIAKAFSEDYEDYNVVVESSSLREAVSIHLMQESYYDIIISSDGRVPSFAINSQLAGYDKNFVDISDVFAHTPEGESLTIAQKTFPSVMEYNTSIDGKQYFAVSAASLWGMLYNVDILGDYSMPRTSDEFVELCGDIKNDGKVPLIFAGDADYWNPIVYTWWAQYEGEESFNKYFEGMAFDEMFDMYRYSTNIFTQKGRLYALEAAETLLNPTNEYTDQNSSAYTYMRAQVDFLQGKSAMMASGGWIENEMDSSFNENEMANIDYMRIPVISKITEKLESVENGDDATLRQIIDYVDDNGTKPAGVSDDDIETVRKARDLTYLIGTSQTAVIPSYSSKIPIAKEFLKYFFSDNAAKVYLESKSGAQLPINTDFTDDTSLMAKMSNIDISRMNLLSNSNMFFNSRKNPIVYLGGLAPFSYRLSIEKAFGSRNSADRVSAYDFYMYDYLYFTANNGAAWNSLLNNSGIN